MNNSKAKGKNEVLMENNHDFKLYKNIESILDSPGDFSTGKSNIKSIPRQSVLIAIICIFKNDQIGGGQYKKKGKPE